jgi:hypothetical protein
MTLARWEPGIFSRGHQSEETVGHRARQDSRASELRLSFKGKHVFAKGANVSRVKVNELGRRGEIQLVWSSLVRLIDDLAEQPQAPFSKFREGHNEKSAKSGSGRISEARQDAAACSCGSLANVNPDAIVHARIIEWKRLAIFRNGFRTNSDSWTS